MLDKNKVELIGRIGKAPDIRKTTDTGCFVVLSIATNEKYKDEQGDHTEWHTVHLNNWIGKKATSLKQGDRVIITGKLRSQKGEDQQTGKTYHSVVIKADGFELLAKLSNLETELLNDKASSNEHSQLKTATTTINKFINKHRAVSKPDAANR